MQPPKAPKSKADVNARILRFVAMTTNEELRALMWRLSAIVTEEDCPKEIVEDCSSLYGLVGAALKDRVQPLITDYESRIARIQKSRDRFNAIRVTRGMKQLDALRDYYFALPEDDLQMLWNNGDNTLPKDDKELIRLALRAKLGIRPHGGVNESVCTKCYLPKANCVCERGWW